MGEGSLSVAALEQPGQLMGSLLALSLPRVDLTDRPHWVLAHKGREGPLGTLELPPRLFLRGLDGLVQREGEGGMDAGEVCTPEVGLADPEQLQKVEPVVPICGEGRNLLSHFLEYAQTSRPLLHDLFQSFYINFSGVVAKFGPALWPLGLFFVGAVWGGRATLPINPL
jgi:hypothetical protein